MSSSCGETDKAVVDAQEGAPSRTARGDIVAGETYSAWWAFKRTTYTRFDEEGGSEVETWAPGWEYEAFGPEDSLPVWQGQGAQLRTVVAVYKPGRFPERVFYTRRWRDPDGKEFGRDGLRITTAEAFRRWRAEEHKARLLPRLFLLGVLSQDRICTHGTERRRPLSSKHSAGRTLSEVAAERRPRAISQVSPHDP